MLEHQNAEIHGQPCVRIAHSYLSLLKRSNAVQFGSKNAQFLLQEIHADGKPRYLKERSGWTS
jgi:hypothetical protein